MWAGKEVSQVVGNDIYLATFIEKYGDGVVRNAGSRREEVFTLTPGWFGFGR